MYPVNMRNKFFYPENRNVRLRAQRKMVDRKLRKDRPAFIIMYTVSSLIRQDNK